MRVEPLLLDAPPAPVSDAGAADFTRALDAIAAALTGANRAEDAFAYGRGTLEDAAYERAQADVALSIATATAQRITQAVQSVLNMQV
jgi:flagellar hook-basal body complex protein FliE